MKVFVEAIFKKIKRKRLLSKNKGQCNVFDGFHTDKKDLFILGTGPSVNNIEDGKFDIIKNNGYSVGMNLWTMHDFIPDCYSIEGMRNFDLANIQKGLLSRVEIARHKPLFLVHNPWEKGVLSYFKDELIDNVMVYTSIFIGLKK